MLPYGVIDAHVHIAPLRMMKPHARELMRQRRKSTAASGSQDFSLIETLMDDPRALLSHMDSEGIERLVAINYVSPDIIGFTEEVNEYAASLARQAPDRLLPCGSVDPRRVKDAAAETERIISELGIRLIKVHPPHQLLYPNAYLTDVPALAGIYAAAERLGVPVMFHTGTSIFPGARNRYGDPMFLDDVAVDFPRLKIIIAHGGRPLWMSAAAFLVRRHPNVYLEVSGIPPSRLLDYFPRLEELADKTLWGSDWPGPMVPGMGHNARQFAALPLSNQAKRLILRSNALRLLWNQTD